MEVEKKRSKVGFLNLFDWNGKSRKKLLSASSESSGRYIFNFTYFLVYILLIDLQVVVRSYALCLTYAFLTVKD